MCEMWVIGIYAKQFSNNEKSSKADDTGLSN